MVTFIPGLVIVIVTGPQGVECMERAPAESFFSLGKSKFLPGLEVDAALTREIMTIAH